MTRVTPVAPEKAKSSLKEIYANIEKNLGRVPNIFLNMGNSPAVLKGFLGLSDAANQTSLDPKIREQIALVVGQTNDCNYCLSAHSAIAKSSGISDADILQARKGHASDKKTESILSFAKKVVESRGKISDTETNALKKAGVSDTEIVEIVLIISLNLFTNYFNHITDPKIDFPIAPKLN